MRCVEWDAASGRHEDLGEALWSDFVSTLTEARSVRWVTSPRWGKALCVAAGCAVYRFIPDGVADVLVMKQVLRNSRA